MAAVYMKNGLYKRFQHCLIILGVTMVTSKLLS